MLFHGLCGPYLEFSLRSRRRGAFIFRPDCGTNKAVTRAPNRKVKPPLDAEMLERAALAYAGRYATTRASPPPFLDRRLRERGGGGAGEPPVARLVERMA